MFPLIAYFGAEAPPLERNTIPGAAIMELIYEKLATIGNH